MLAGLTLVANASHYWLGSWFDVEPTHGDKMADVHTAERCGCGKTCRVGLYVCLYGENAALRQCVGS